MSKSSPVRTKRKKARSSSKQPATIAPVRREPVNWKKLTFLACTMAAVMVCVAVAHWPALSGKAMCSDDLEYLVANPLVKNPSWDSAGRFLGEVLRPSTVGGYYQPLSMISLMLDYAAGGREQTPRAFHRTSLTLHLANTLLIIALMYLLFGSVIVAGMVGLLFGLHPMTVEPIPWISERKTLLASLFALMCLVLYVRYTQRRGWLVYMAALVTFVLALMSKPTSVPLPACMLLMDIWPLRRISRKAVWEKVPFFAAAAASAFITFFSQRSTFGVDMPSKYGPLRIPLILCHNIVFYLSKIFWPNELSPHYPFPDPVAISHPMVLAGVIGTAVLIAALIVATKWTRAPLVGWLFFFTAMFPTMGVIGFTVVVASDKFAYLPSVGLLMILAGLLAWLWRVRQGALGKVIRAATVVVAVAIAIALAAVTRTTVGHWRDTFTLNDHMLSVTPDAAWVHNCAAVNLIRHGRQHEAEKLLARAMELDANYAEPYNSLGFICSQRGQLDEAIRLFSEAIRIRPGYKAARMNLLRAKAMKKQHKLSPTPASRQAK